MPAGLNQFGPIVGAIVIICTAGALAWGEEARDEATNEGPSGQESPKPNRYEVAPFPSIGGNTDIGFQFGFNGTLTRFGEDYVPFRWRFQLIAEATAQSGPEGAVFPSHRYLIRGDLTGLLQHRLRLLFEAGFERIINAGYYGLDGLSSVDPQGRLALRGGHRHQFKKQQPRADVDLRFPLPVSDLELLVGGQFRHVMVRTYGDSVLSEDQAWQRHDGSPVLVGLEPHALAALRLGLLWDGRDDEILPSKGLYASVAIRGGLGFPQRFAFGGMTTDFRLYVPLLPDRKLGLAMRTIFDLMVGDVPFYELSWMGAFVRFKYCGKRGVRGAPEGRYAGAAKAIESLELRSLFAPFRLFNLKLAFGMHAFLIAGQSWAALRPTAPFVDGGPRTTWGAGGGCLLRWGEALVVRAEVGYSPDSTDASLPVGIYLDMGYAY
jgi:hypothetical protein